MTNKIRNIITVTVLAISTSTIMGILVFTYTQQAAIAQYQNFTGSEQSEKAEEKRKNLCNERSFRSFHRSLRGNSIIKNEAKMNNGILQIQLQKKSSTKVQE